MPIEIRSTAGVLRGSASITSVDLDLRTITLDMAIAGVVSTDIIFHKGAYNNEFAGVHKILTNTGELFGINASTYNLWKGNEYSAGSAALSMAKLQGAISRGVEKGLDEDVKVYVNPKSWDNLLTEQSALRMYDQSYSSEESKNGSKSIKFYSQNGLVEIIPSIYVKEGYAYVLCLYEFSRIGSTDVTFKLPGQNDKFIKGYGSNSHKGIFRNYNEDRITVLHNI